MAADRRALVMAWLSSGRALLCRIWRAARSRRARQRILAIARRMGKSCTRHKQARHHSHNRARSLPRLAACLFRGRLAVAAATCAAPSASSRFINRQRRRRRHCAALSLLPAAFVATAAASSLLLRRSRCWRDEADGGVNGGTLYPAACTTATCRAANAYRLRVRVTYRRGDGGHRAQRA